MPDFDEIMKMAQNAQAELMKAQEGLDKVEVEGLSGGGLVRIRASAKGRILAVQIDESLLQPSEKEVVEDLVDLRVGQGHRAPGVGHLAHELLDVIDLLGLLAPVVPGVRAGRGPTGPGRRDAGAGRRVRLLQVPL